MGTSGDDMVLLKDGVVKLTAPSAARNSPTLESAVADCPSSHNGEFKVEALAGESAAVLPLCLGENQKQTDVEKEERNLEVEQVNIAEYIGRKVLKRFGRKDFIGDVVNYEPEYKWYKVIYEDGDEEDLERAEVEAILLPLGSFPAFASRKRPPPEGAVEEDRYERDLKKMKEVEVGKPYGEGNKAGFLKSKKIHKNLGAVADSQGYKGKIFSKRDTSTDKLRGIGRDSDINRPSSWKPGKPCRSLLQKNRSGLTGNKTVSSVIKNKKAKVGKGSLCSPQKGSLSNTSSPFKLKILKEWKGGQENPSQALGDMENSCSPCKSETKERRRSGTGITLQEGIKRYLQKLKDSQQKTIPRAKRKVDEHSNARPGSKHSKKEATQNFRAAVNPFSEDLEDSNQRNRASKYSIMEGHDSDGVELGAALVGRFTSKQFNGKFYRGNVVSYDKKTKFYKVRYEDGDQEDLEWNELEPTLAVKRKQNAPAKFLETTQNIWSAGNSVSEGLRVAKPSKAEGYLEGVEPEATLIGRSTRKKFSGKFYIGNVVSFDKKRKFYKVRYEDGDQEDLEWSELAPTLVDKRKQNAPAKSTSTKRSTSKSISDRSDFKHRKTRSIPH